tara:strand:+ start:607 stop:1080 length:474 start_codon:yes stop_codon:yes gene_type:complete
MLSQNFISAIDLEESSKIRRSAQVEHERKVAIFDLLEENSFSLRSGPDGPYRLRIQIKENRLIFNLNSNDDVFLLDISLAVAIFRKIVRDYFLICESYFQAIKTKTPSQIEAIDMARRGLHDEGAELLQNRMAEQVEMDLQTARRLFTLVCVLHIRA